MIKIIRASEKPLTLMGEVASFCWNSNPSKEIGIKCLKSNHGRVAEYPDVTISIEEYSARMIRELYTHIIGTSRLQESTRYVNYKDFQFYIPDDAKDHETYFETFDYISKQYKKLLEEGVSKEDAANILPLGMFTKIVLKINLRAILYLFELRTCMRVYEEFREFMVELQKVLENIDDEWKYIVDNFAITKCVKHGYCSEEKSCGYCDTDYFLNDVAKYRTFIGK